MAALVMLSGGIDSTAALAHLLTADDQPVFAHYIVKKDAESPHMAAAETHAVNRIVPYCQKAYRPFQFTHSVWDFRLPYFGWNLTLCAFVGAQVIRSFGTGIDRYVTGVNYEHFHGLGDWERRVQEAEKTFEAAFTTSNRERLPAIEWPLAEMTKQQVVDTLPVDLLELTWSCRHPVPTSEKNGFDVCGVCVACKTLQKVTGLHRSFSPDVA